MASEGNRLEPLSRAQLVHLAAVPDVVMIFWDRRGLIVPYPRRTPTARRSWPWYEANIAGLMMQLRQFGVPIDGLLSITAKFREAIAWADRYGIDRNDVFGLWSVFTSHAFHERGEYDDDELAASLDLWSEEGHGAQRITPRLRQIHASMPKAEFRQHLDAYLLITDQPARDAPRAQYHPDMTYFWLAGDQWHFARGEGAPRRARDDGAIASIAVDVATVIYDVWNRP